MAGNSMEFQLFFSISIELLYKGINIGAILSFIEARGYVKPVI